MLTFRFSTSADPSEESAGFCQGSITAKGDQGELSFDHLMVVLSVTLLVDQIVAWLEKGTPHLTFGFVDRGEDIEFERVKTMILLKARGRLLGSAPQDIFLESLDQAARQLEADFVAKLPERDMAKPGFYMALDVLTRFLSKERAQPHTEKMYRPRRRS